MMKSTSAPVCSSAYLLPAMKAKSHWQIAREGNLILESGRTLEYSARAMKPSTSLVSPVVIISFPRVGCGTASAAACSCRILPTPNEPRGKHFHTELFKFPVTVTFTAVRKIASLC